LFYTLYFIVW